MTMLRFFSAIAILLIALVLQVTLASAGIYFNLALAALIASAFIFDFWEVLVLDLLAVFLLNWQPAPSIELIAFALIPPAAFGFRKFTHWHGWIGNLLAIIAGFFVFYVAAAPPQFFPHIAGFLEDAASGLIMGELVLLVLD